MAIHGREYMAYNVKSWPKFFKNSTKGHDFAYFCWGPGTNSCKRLLSSKVSWVT